jgi:hypothetical protein
MVHGRDVVAGRGDNTWLRMTMSGTTTSGWPAVGFHGTLTPTSDDSGLTVTVNAADAPSSPLATFWWTWFFGAIAGSLGSLYRANCLSRYATINPGATPVQNLVFKDSCATTANMISTGTTGILQQAHEGTLASETAWANTLAKLAAGMVTTAAWEGGLYTSFYASVIADGQWLQVLAKTTAWTWVAADVGTAGAELVSVGNELKSQQSTLLAPGPRRPRPARRATSTATSTHPAPTPTARHARCTPPMAKPGRAGPNPANGRATGRDRIDLTVARRSPGGW